MNTNKPIKRSLNNYQHLTESLRKSIKNLGAIDKHFIAIEKNPLAVYVSLHNYFVSIT